MRKPGEMSTEMTTEMSITSPYEFDGVTRDDELIDALSRGELPPTDDHVLELLHLWREHLALDDDHGLAGRSVDASVTAILGHANGFEDESSLLLAPVGFDGQRPSRHFARHSRQAGRGRLVGLASRRAMIGAAVFATAVASLTGVAAAAGSADPGSPLWPITQVVSPERAHSLSARQEAYDLVTRAREKAKTDPQAAIDLLNEAERKAGEVRTEDDQAMILATLAATKQQIEQASPGVTGSPTDPTLPGGPSDPGASGDGTASPQPGSSGSEAPQSDPPQPSEEPTASDEPSSQPSEQPSDPSPSGSVPLAGDSLEVDPESVF